MPKFLYLATYSPGSWARMMRISENRVKAVSELAGSLGGSVECVYWEVSSRSVYAVAELPDASAAAALAAVLSHTGAFKNVEVHEVLTQEQFNGVLDLAESVAGAYSPPGAGLLRDDSSESRFQR